MLKGLTITVIAVWAANFLAWSAGLALLFAPVYQDETASATEFGPAPVGGAVEMTRHSTTLLEAHGLWVLPALFVPVQLAAYALWALRISLPRGLFRVLLLWALAWTLVGCCAVSLLGLGPYYLPAAVALLIAAYAATISSQPRKEALSVTVLGVWAANAFAWAAGLALLVVPVYEGESVSATAVGAAEVVGEVTRHSATLVEANGPFVLPLLLVPIGLTGLALFGLQYTRPGRPLRAIFLWTTALPLMTICAVSVLSLGALYLPAAIALLLAAVAHILDRPPRQEARGG